MSSSGRPLRLGLLSTARINDKIIAGAAGSEQVEVAAVASRDAARAAAYANEHGIARSHASYEGLLADPDVDAVYVSLPNALHVPWTLQALEAGKHVLCEKPLDPRPEEVERAFAAAQERGLVLAEAFMWRHHPQAKRMVELVREGAIGELRLIRATFSFTLARYPDVRLDPALEGGALLDVGCYCVSGARLLAGEPERGTAYAVKGPTGVDVRTAGTLELPGGVLATFDCGFDVPGRAALEAIGAEGTLLIQDPWLCTRPGIHLLRGGEDEFVEMPDVDPYRLELEDLADAIADGRPPLVGREDAVAQARALAPLLRAVKDG